MTGAATPGGGVEAGFTWSFRAGPRADRGPARSECGPRPGWLGTGQRVNRPV